MLELGPCGDSKHRKHKSQCQYFDCHWLRGTPVQVLFSSFLHQPFFSWPKASWGLWTALCPLLVFLRSHEKPQDNELAPSNNLRKRKYSSDDFHIWNAKNLAWNSSPVAKLYCSQLRLGPFGQPLNDYTDRHDVIFTCNWRTEHTSCAHLQGIYEWDLHSLIILSLKASMSA